MKTNKGIVFKTNKKKNRVIVGWVISCVIATLLSLNFILPIFKEASIVVYFYATVLSFGCVLYYISTLYRPLFRRQRKNKIERQDFYKNRCDHFVSEENIKHAVYFFDNGITHSYDKDMSARYYGFLLSKLGRKL